MKALQEESDHIYIGLFRGENMPDMMRELLRIIRMKKG